MVSCFDLITTFPKSSIYNALAVTGYGRGIGKALALKLASEGVKIIINDLD